MIMHAGKFVAPHGNCIAQDETTLLSYDNKYRVKSLGQLVFEELDSVEESLNTMELSFDRDSHLVEERVLCSSKGCIPNACKVCSASLTYIAGFYAFKFLQMMTCPTCKASMVDSEADPCTDASLILFKNYDEAKKGLTTPSGSMVRLLMLCEGVIRRNINALHVDNIEEKLLRKVLSSLDTTRVFNSLTGHALETAEGINNHLTTLIRLVSKRHIRLRIKKMLKDKTLDKVHGNYLHRLRIFQNV